MQRLNSDSKNTIDSRHGDVRKKRICFKANPMAFKGAKELQDLWNKTLFRISVQGVQTRP